MPPIYVQIDIDAPMEELWRLTQTPGLHARWDLRFTDIEYLPRDDPDGPQRFLYATRLGFGLRIAGTGETAGQHERGGGRTSALKFASDDPRSLIEEGSGYWKYLPRSTGPRDASRGPVERIRFLTRYDYRTRWGLFGRVFDRVVFRPLMGWATAWSFDRLRLWLEKGIDPALSLHRTIVHTGCRLLLVLVFLWHGIVPKLIARDPMEVEPIVRTGLFPGWEERLMLAAGVAEIAYAAVLLIFWHARWLYALSGMALVGLGAGACITVPETVTQPFNPVSLTLLLAGVCLLGWLSAVDLPSARRCLRRRPETHK